MVKEKPTKKRILIVEDEAIVAADIKSSLESLGYEIINIISSGEEAILAANSNKPDLIVMDIKLKGGVDGIEAAEKIAELNIPIIYLTAYSDKKTVERAKKTCPYNFLFKPFESRELSTAVEIALYKNEIEKKLVESRERFKMYINIADVIIVAIDNAGIVTFINQKGCDILGYKENEIIGQNWFKKFLPDRIKKETLKYSDELLSGRANPGEYHENPVLTSDGRERIIAWRRKIIKDKNGKATGHLSSGEDITERKQAEEKINNISREWMETFNSMADGVSIHSVNCEILNANNSLLKVLGKEKKDVVGKKCYQVFHNLGAPIKECPLKRSLKTKKMEEVEYFEPYINSWLSITANPVVDKQGKIIKVIHIIRDISEHKQAEEKLKESEEKFKAIFNEAGDGILAADAETHKFVFVNPAICNLLGYTEDELLGLGVADIHPKKDLPYVADQFEKQAQGKIRLAKNIPILTKQGKILFCDVNSVPTIIKDKKLLLGFFRDITERRKSEEAIHENEERLKILFEYAPDAIYINDLKGNFIDGNKEAEKLLGNKKEELIGKSFLKLNILSAAQIPKAAVSLAKNALGKPTGPEEYTLNCGNSDKQVEVEIRSFPVKIKGRTIVLGIARDISERKKLDENIEKRNKELERFNKLSVGRELRMIELKKRVKELEERLAN